MPPPRELENLVENFDRNIASYRSSSYNEAQVRVEFIDPLFELLGWDVHNKAGNAEAYKDVIHEDAIQIGGTVKAPDYCFRIGGTRKFFLEAKKPSVSIKDEPEPAFQLRRYAWSRKLPLSILTDFEELAVYDCRLKPAKNDKPATGRIRYLTFDEYPDRWDEIATSSPRRRCSRAPSTTSPSRPGANAAPREVDAAFLKEIERWRDLLARNIALRNPDSPPRAERRGAAHDRPHHLPAHLRGPRHRDESQWQLTLARERRQRLPPAVRAVPARGRALQLRPLPLPEGEGARRSRRTRSRLNLAIDDKCSRRSSAASTTRNRPYEFSVLPADILGQVYEQFLGKVIRLTAGHQAKVEDKPEVKKAGGVYYTPTYIVDYIVENTVGKLLEGQDAERGCRAEDRSTRPAAPARSCSARTSTCSTGIATGTSSDGAGEAHQGAQERQPGCTRRRTASGG